MTVAVVAPIHDLNDVRIYGKEVPTLLEAGYTIHCFAPTDRGRSHRISGVYYHALRKLPRSVRPAYYLLLALRLCHFRADVYHLHNPDTLIIGAILSAFGRRVVYDSHEDFRQRIMMRDWIPQQMRRFVAVLVAQAERQLASHFFRATIVTQQQIVRRIPMAHVIENAPELSIAANSEPARISSAGQLRLVYIGQISAARRIELLVELARELSVGTTFDVVLDLAGPIVGADYGRRLQGLPGWHLTRYHGYLPRADAIALVRSAHLGFLLLPDIGDFPQTSPNKLFEYMACGRPYVASSFSTWVHRLSSTESGVFVTPGISTTELTSTVKRMVVDPDNFRKMGANGMAYISDHFNWDRERQKLLHIYAQL